MDVIKHRAGSPIKVLTNPQKIEFIALTRKMHGRHRAANMIGVSYRIVKNTFDLDEEFRAELVAAESEPCEEILQKFFSEIDHLEWKAAHSARLAILHRDDRQKLQRQAFLERKQNRELLKSVSTDAATHIPKLIDLMLDLVPPEKHEELNRRMLGLVQGAEALGQLNRAKS